MGELGQVDDLLVDAVVVVIVIVIVVSEAADGVVRQIEFVHGGREKVQRDGDESVPRRIEDGQVGQVLAEDGPRQVVQVAVADAHGVQRFVALESIIQHCPWNIDAFPPRRIIALVLLLLLVFLLLLLGNERQLVVREIQHRQRLFPMTLPELFSIGIVGIDRRPVVGLDQILPNGKDGPGEGELQAHVAQLELAGFARIFDGSGDLGERRVGRGELLVEAGPWVGVRGGFVEPVGVGECRV